MERYADIVQELKRLRRSRRRIKFIGYIRKTGRTASYVRVDGDKGKG
ncbi:hypothetical protein [Thermofilum pendens]|nr:hypothetical protein [Thermofilum pendens]